MSSSAKTEKMGLNQWQGTDIPKRNDFNTDNQKIEDFVTTHTENTVLHTTQAEKMFGTMFIQSKLFSATMQIQES